jgi:hypothetical protein
MPTKEGEFYIKRGAAGDSYEFTITQKSGPLGWGRCIATTIQQDDRPARDFGDRNEYKFRTNGRGYIKVYGCGGGADGINYCIAEKRR